MFISHHAVGQVQKIFLGLALALASISQTIHEAKAQQISKAYAPQVHDIDVQQTHQAGAPQNYDVDVEQAHQAGAPQVYDVDVQQVPKVDGQQIYDVDIQRFHEFITPKVYFGVADQWFDLLNHPDQWTYVQQHADGFYVNYVMMNRVIQHVTGLAESNIAQTCGLFATHTAYLESDLVSASEQQEDQYIDMLHTGGCQIDYTSLNYGWSFQRAENLKTYELLQGENRLNFVQTAPWRMNGSIYGASTGNYVYYNPTVRQEIQASDGASTDDPLGYWSVDYDGDRSANVSLVHFAHQQGKKVMVMLAPFGASIPSYEATRDILGVGQDMVRYLESQNAIPDIWAVFEYSTDIPAVPEQINGEPANTTSGLAYWLINHIADPQKFP